MGAFDHLEWTYDEAFEQLFGTGRGSFKQKCSKNSNVGGLLGQDVEASVWLVHYMTSSESGQDEPNRMLWLATRAGKMERYCPLWVSHLVPQDQRSFFGVLSHIINPLLTKLVRSRWPDIGLVKFFFCMFMDLDSSQSINMQKKNLANIQPSWPNKLGQ